MPYLLKPGSPPGPSLPHRELACLTMTDSAAVLKGDLRFSSKFLARAPAASAGDSS